MYKNSGSGISMVFFSIETGIESRKSEILRTTSARTFCPNFEYAAKATAVPAANPNSIVTDLFIIFE